MKRLTSVPRPHATDIVRSQGLVYTRETDPSDMFHLYWREDRYMSFTSEEIALLEEAQTAVFAMCDEAGDHIVERPALMTKMGIPEFAFPAIIESWNRDPAWGSVYGRFDFRFGGLDNPDPALRVPQAYEFNADTPTSIVESAAIQWYWLEQTGLGHDQCNSLYERLVDAWRRNLALISMELGHTPTVYFAADQGQGSGEDEMNVALLADTCNQAGYDVRLLFMGDIVLGDDGRFYDGRNDDGTVGNHIDVIFKLHPWEYLVTDEFGRAAFADMANVGKRDEFGDYIGGTVWIEAPYKMLWSNKAIFAVLWDLFKDDPRSKYLIPTFFEGEEPASSVGYARKPMLGREGADIVLQNPDGSPLLEAKKEGYGGEGFIMQELALPAAFTDADGQDWYAVLGLWMADGEPAGMGIRESRGPVTDDFANFVPHVIEDGPVRFEAKPVTTLDDIARDYEVTISQYRNPLKESL